MATQTFSVAAPTGNARTDTDAIKAAIQAAHQAYLLNPSAGQVTVKLAPGTYIVTGNPTNPSAGPVELRSGVSLVGEGMGETTIKLVDGFNARINGIVRTALETVSNVSISDLTIDGNRANNAGHQAGFISGIKEDESGRTQSDITISHVEIKNCTAYGFNPHELTYNVVIRDSVAHHNGLDGFVADAVVGGVYENNRSYSNDRHGFNVQNATQDLLLLNNKAYDNGYGSTGGAGIVIQRGDVFPEGETTIPWVSNIQIKGGEYYRNNKEGVLIKLSDSVTIDGAMIYSNLRQGVRIEGSTNTTVQNSQVFNNSQEAHKTYDEIQIRLRFDTVFNQNYYSTGTQILNNLIYSDGAIDARFGIREEKTNTDGGPTGTYIAGNSISGMASGSISVPNYVWNGTANNDVLDGTSGGEEMRGLGGDDTYIVNHSGDLVVEAAGEGTDHVRSSITYTLTANVENLTLTGSAAINGYGNELGNKLTGNAAANVLKGAEGNDTLDGGAGADTLDGGDGDDTYYVDNAKDQIVEKLNTGLGGYDKVYSSVSYVLSAQVEELELTGSAHLNGTGNSGANTLIGNAGNNVLNGLGGADTMTGGLGNDRYYVDHTGDLVIEDAGAGTDTVYSTISHTLAQHVENLILQGTASTGIGNEMNNVLAGNDGNNKLYGHDGNDTLRGGAGDDLLDGGPGVDTAVYSNLRQGYALTGDLRERTVASSDGTDTLLSVDILQFADGRLVFDVSDRAAVVYRMYDSAFGRAPDTKGFNSWISSLERGADVNDMAAAFAASAEFKSIYGSLSNRQFVEQLYRNVLNREGTETDVNQWTDALETGSTTRGLMLAVFSESDEHIEITRPAVLAGLWDANDPTQVGTNNSDNLIGSSGPDFIQGLGGNDTMRGGAGDDLLDGGTGVDTSVYAGLSRTYTLSGSLKAYTVASASKGTDALTSVEVLQFVDGRMVFDVSDPAAIVYRMYDSAFNRAPDSLGLNSWITALENGKSVSSMAAAFAASSEFKAKYGALSNQQFVEQLYRNVLDREGDAGGVSHWANALDASTLNRGQVLAKFSESAEHISLMRPAVEKGLWDQDETAVSVARLYYAAFDRAPDAGGLTGWTDSVKSGNALANVADKFAASAEFKATYGSLSNQKFVEQLYLNSLDRQGDAGGINYWTQTLDAGQLDRGDVLVRFSESFEHQQKTQVFFDGGILIA
jgi:parallel beta-helix repeat protein